MKSLIFPFAVAVIARTSYAVKTQSDVRVVDKYENYWGHSYHWYDAPYFACVAYAEDYSYVEYFDADECCLVADLGCDRAGPDAHKEWNELSFHGDTCGVYYTSRYLSVGQDGEIEKWEISGYPL